MRVEETVGPAPLGMSFTLATIIPGARKRVELEGARIFFPDERAPEFSQLVRAHWLGTEP